MMLLRGQLQLREDLLTDYQLKSRMTGDCHVRFREGLGGKFPRSTRLASRFADCNKPLFVIP
jgi:hypothetical protein